MKLHTYRGRTIRESLGSFLPAHSAQGFSTLEGAQRRIDSDLERENGWLAANGCKYFHMEDAAEQGSVGDTVRFGGDYWGVSRVGTIEWIHPERVTLIVRDGREVSYCDSDGAIAESIFSDAPDTWERLLESRRAWSAPLPED
jgi:hypothetical protein